MPSRAPLTPTPLSPEDLAFWYSDQPRQRTTMALLMLLDRKPDPRRLRAAVMRAADAVPRLRQRVVDAPFDLALPRWEEDPTFDLDFHLRRYALAEDEPYEDDLARLFRTLGPIYERPFERTRPLWELIEIDRPGGTSALFFKLHHAVADGVGGNTILAALTDAAADAGPLPLPQEKPPGAWPEPGLGAQLADALRRRVQEDASRLRAAAGALLHGVRHPSVLVGAAQVLGDVAREIRAGAPSSLSGFGRARHLGGLELPFARLREARDALGCKTIDVLLTGVVGAVGRWYAGHGLGKTKELRTLVPINLRPRAEQGMSAGTGNRATGILVRLPIAPLASRGRAPSSAHRALVKRAREIHRRVEEAKARQALAVSEALPQLLAALPRPLYRAVALGVSSSVDLIVTNVPGVPVARYVAGAEITAAYPFAPLGPHSPLSVALYGYRDRIFIGLDSDGALLPDPSEIAALLVESFEELVAAARAARSRSKSSSA